MVIETAMKHSVTKVDVKTNRDHIALPRKQLQLLLQIADEVGMRRKPSEPKGRRNRLIQDSGITALFSGENVTGKTIAAKVMATELSLDLYRVDLSSVVSKYIGETEKNLDKVFDAAGNSSAILLFDEADALFGKRSEIKDSHDRFSNIEINYLMQRMETFSGLVILTTNIKSALDESFLRRVKFVVDFPVPDNDQRTSPWHADNLPPMLQFNLNDPGDTPYKMRRAVKESGLTLQKICNRMKSDYGVTLTPSAVSRSVNRGTLSLQHALQILAICGVTEVEIKGKARQ